MNFLFLALWPGVAAAWDCANVHRTPVTLTAGPDGHAEEIRVDLAAADFPASYVFTPSGADVRVFASDDTTPIDHVVTRWDGAARTGTLYIRPPPLAPNASTGVLVYYGDAGAADISDAASVFPNTGMRLLSRATSADPDTTAAARTAFAATADMVDTVRASVTGLTNLAIGGAFNDFAWCISTMVEVTPATAGLWEFRYGADFGHGGHLYVADQELEQQWSDDLWWNMTYADPAQTLEGAISLQPGWHRYEALGFEDCCDGAVGWQARAPGGPWQDMNTTNFSLRAARCEQDAVIVTTGAPESCSTTLTASKTAAVVAGPDGGATPYALPGAVVEYAMTISNPGAPVDSGSIALTDALPTDVALVVAGGGAFTLSDGATPSGLALGWGGAGDAGDDVAFSTNGATFDYTPVPDAGGADPAVTHVRFTPTGAMNASVDGDTPAFTIRFQTIVR